MSPIPVLLSALLSFVPAPGQSVGANLAGVVTDDTGARLQDATVTITHVLNGRAVTVKTGPLGEYRMVALLPGDYDIAAARGGFRSANRRVALLVGADATVNLALSLAPVVEATTVRADPSLVEAARSQPSSIVTNQDIATLPLLDRNFLMLAQLLPGSGPINGTVNRLATTKFGGPADQRVGYSTLIDGGDISDSAWGSPTINVGEEAIQEFKVFRHQFDAQYGHALTAVVTVATKSGTNRFAGSGFYFGRDDALNAPIAFADGKPPFDEQRAGASMGGPIVRSRTHFFVSYERDDVDSVRIIALPEGNPFAAANNGMFPAAQDNQMASARLDHRFGAAHQFSARYASDRQQSLRANLQGTSDSSQVDIRNRSHSLVLDDTWMAQQNFVNAFRVHVLAHRLETTPRDNRVAVRWKSATEGLTVADAWSAPVNRVTLSDALYFHTPQTELKVGGEVSVGSHTMDSHVFENGFFDFQSVDAFSVSDNTTWPRVFTQQKPARTTYDSQEIGLFVQSDWRLGNRIRLNAGLRYDLDLNLRMNDFYGTALDDPRYQGLDYFISRDRGTDTNNVQPRLGVTWDGRGDGRLIVRGGWGIYVTRNRPWFQMRSMNQFESSAVRITARPAMQNYNNTAAVLGGLDLDTYLTRNGGRQLGTVIPDGFVQPYAMNTTAGIAWQLDSTTSLTLDYIHSYGNHQTGTTDVNLPPSDPISATNPRPVLQFSVVGMVENFSKSWYDALESQVRTRLGARGSLQVSYTFSRSYLDGVDFFLNMRGTQRTPREVGYNPSDQRHNLTAAGTVSLPWTLQMSGILKLVSGSPIKVQAGTDLDGDTSTTGDLPLGVPITLGRERLAESLLAINQYRANLQPALPPIDASLLELDAYGTLDLRLTKSFRVGSAHRLDLLVEGFNVTNRVNLRPPNAPFANLNNGNFLQRTAARDARQIQWGVRYVF